MHKLSAFSAILAAATLVVSFIILALVMVQGDISKDQTDTIRDSRELSNLMKQMRDEEHAWRKELLAKIEWLAMGLESITPKLAPLPTPTPSMSGMMQSPVSQDFAPVVKGFYKGGEVLFIHTEASDAQVANMLTRMMGPQVVLVPSLANAPAAMVNNVYVFTNGIKGNGPFGFQEDIFDSIPGDRGYSSLRAIHVVTWREEVTPRLLRSVEELISTQAKSEVVISPAGAIVNMPVLAWPGGHR